MTRAFNKPIVCPIVVGRLADVTKLYELVDEASSGHGQIVLISGEAGVGKSRLIEEVKAYARTHNFQVFQGNCFQVDSSYPYAPLLDLLRTSVEPNAYDAGVEPIFLEFARLLPELSFSLTETPSEFLSDPEQRKHRLFAALTHFFKEQSHQRPVLLIIEDLHWCDDISLEFFQSLARLCRNQAILFLATYRSDEIQPSLQYFLSQLDRIRMSQELRLSPLSRSDIEKMLDTMFSLSDDERLHLLDLIYPLTEGNPFFAEEVLTLLIARDELLFDNGTWHYKLLIEKRNERLPNLTLHARSLNRLGNWLVNTGHIQEGIEAHQAALHLFETQLNMQDMAETLDLLAVAYGFDGNSASAVKTLERAIELFRRLGNQRGLLSSLASGSLDSAPEKIITTVSPLKTRDECMQNVREALQLAHQTNLQSELAFVEFVAAQVLLSFGEFGNAFDHAQKSLRIATAIEHQQWLTASYGALGQLYLLLLAPSQAISALRLGMMYAETLGSAFWHSYLASFLAQTYVLQRDFSSAEKLLKSIMPREQEPANAGERHIAYIWGELALADGRTLDVVCAEQRRVATHSASPGFEGQCPSQTASIGRSYFRTGRGEKRCGAATSTVNTLAHSLFSGPCLFPAPQT